MRGASIVSFVLCVWVLASFHQSHGMRIIKQTSTTTVDDGEDTAAPDGLTRFLQLLENPDDLPTPHGTDDITDDITDELEADDSEDDTSVLLKGCKKGKCELCKGSKFLKLCVIAEVLKQGFSASVTVNGKSVLKKEITVATPPPLCVGSIPGLEKVSKLCIQLTNINLKEKSGCLKASFTVKLGPVHKTIKLNLGCFKIPVSDDTTTEDDLNSVGQLIRLLSPDTGVAAGQVSMSPEDVDSAIEALIAELENVDEVDFEEFLKGCSKGHCSFCTPGHFLKLCIEAGILTKQVGFEVTVTLNGKQIYHTEISIANPPPICFNHIPALKHITNLCIEIYDVNLQSKSACVRISFKILIKKIHLKLGCFRIPVADDLFVETDDKSVALTGVPSDDGQDIVLQFESHQSS